MSAKICGEKGEIYVDSRWHRSQNHVLSNIIKHKKFDFLGVGDMFMK